MNNHVAVGLDSIKSHLKGQEIRQTLGEFVESNDDVWQITSYNGEKVSYDNIDKVSANYRIWAKKLEDSSGMIIKVIRRKGNVYIAKKMSE